MRDVLGSVTFAVLLSLALLVVGAAVASAAWTAGSWIRPAATGTSVFTAAMCTAAALRRRRARTGGRR
ncbi:hypothetical protein DEI99_015305 [Curtobacterium sp. MCLR17_036]|uniref:hypothetical protein n=1 Tax=Curtobacterium sp. MCLR17_036 TaxID=2175620 RepID=UPI000DA70F7C|nr:hypothetical protein [Curtobacterium sp. MCLR17_036]WIE64577.1 hypothetical protein DEI99_015305 [Curtobacterium sp. MCLR17_036]